MQRTMLRSPSQEPAIMPDGRSSFYDFDVTKMMSDFRFKPFDVEALWAAQKRNIEALSQANQLAVEGVHAIARRQIEIARQHFEDLTALARDLGQPVSIEDRIAKNTEYAKAAIEKSVSHGRELAEMASKSGSEAAGVLHKRATEGLDEIRALATKPIAH
jgi:phasin family protein